MLISDVFSSKHSEKKSEVLGLDMATCFLVIFALLVCGSI